MKREQIYRAVFNQNFNGAGLDESISFEFISNENLIMNDNYNGIKAMLEMVDGIAYSVNDEEICTVLDLELFTDFSESNVCVYCFGEGFTEERKECWKQASDCCGGCTEYVECECKPYYDYE